MMETDNLFKIKVKRFFKEIKNFIALVLFVLFTIGVTYLCYYVFVLSDNYILNYSGEFFTPLASALNPNDDSLEIYKNTGIKFLLVDILVLVLYRFIVSIENIVFDVDSFIDKQKEKSRQLKEEKEYEAQFEAIDKFSICTSFLIENSKNKAQIAKIFAERMRSFYENSEFKNFAQSQDKTTVLIISQYKIKIFDNLLDETMQFLALFKKQIEKQYNSEITFTITIDAYKNSPNSKKIIELHNKIKNVECFKNRVLSQDLFALKYKHLEATKHESIPIGLYVLENDDKVGLNLIVKNLNSELEKL